MPNPGDNFARNGYVPQIGHIVHLDWAPAVGHEMTGPHYGLVVSADAFNMDCVTTIILIYRIESIALSWRMLI